MPHRTELPGAREGDKWMPQPIVILDETSPFKGLLRASGILKEYNVLITACPPPKLRAPTPYRISDDSHALRRPCLQDLERPT